MMQHVEAQDRYLTAYTNLVYIYTCRSFACSFLQARLHARMCDVYMGKLERKNREINMSLPLHIGANFLEAVANRKRL